MDKELKEENIKPNIDLQLSKDSITLKDDGKPAFTLKMEEDTIPKFTTTEMWDYFA